jgi:hypothetical protein
VGPCLGTADGHSCAQYEPLAFQIALEIPDCVGDIDYSTNVLVHKRNSENMQNFKNSHKCMFVIVGN